MNAYLLAEGHKESVEEFGSEVQFERLKVAIRLSLCISNECFDSLEH